MDVKKIAAAAIAAAMVGTISLTTAPALLNQYLLTASAASLQLSSSGDEVKQLQQYLIRLNYLKSGSDTGSFDDATEGAVKNLQKDYGLKSDGIAGNSTVSLVNGLIKGNAQVLEVEAGRDINKLIRELFPDAKEIASNLPEITIAICGKPAAKRTA